MNVRVQTEEAKREQELIGGQAKGQRRSSIPGLMGGISWTCSNIYMAQ